MIDVEELAAFIRARNAEARVSAREDAKPRTVVVGNAVGMALLGINVVQTSGTGVALTVNRDPAPAFAWCDAVDALVDDIQAETHEVVDGDCWYTCAAATEERDGGETCREGLPAVCDCGRDRRVERRLRRVAAFRRFRTVHPKWREEWAVD